MFFRQIGDKKGNPPPDSLTRARRDSNPRSFESESNTLSTELRAQNTLHYTPFSPGMQPPIVLHFGFAGKPAVFRNQRKAAGLF